MVPGADHGADDHEDQDGAHGQIDAVHHAVQDRLPGVAVERCHARRDGGGAEQRDVGFLTEATDGHAEGNHQEDDGDQGDPERDVPPLLTHAM
jgi:hypothetical protein